MARRGPAAKKALLKLQADSKRIYASREVDKARSRYLKNKTDGNFRHYTKIYDRWFSKTRNIHKKITHARQRLVEAVEHDLRMVK